MKQNIVNAITEIRETVTVTQSKNQLALALMRIRKAYDAGVLSEDEKRDFINDAEEAYDYRRKVGF